jgi:chemotaxis protein methyltransferase CheR
MAITSSDFEFVSAVIRQDSAIVLERGKEYLVESRLAPVARNHGFAGLDELVQRLRQPGSTTLRTQVVEALTTNETSFFRDVEPFELLRTTILPELIQRRADRRQLTIWCAASSTGQEPYSVAMLLRDHFPQLNDWKLTFIATDISKDVLERARAGKFSQLEVNRGLPITYLVKYFEKVGTDFQLKSDIRKMIRFEEFNLIKPFTTLPELDIVMIRNVLIYFDVPTKREILAKIRKLLRPDGFLLLGAAETTLNIDENFVRRAVGKASCYQRKP